MVRAFNDGGEAQSIANFVFMDQTQIESSSLQVDIHKEVSFLYPFLWVVMWYKTGYG